MSSIIIIENKLYKMMIYFQVLYHFIYEIYYLQLHTFLINRIYVTIHLHYYNTKYIKNYMKGRTNIETLYLFIKM